MIDSLRPLSLLLLVAITSCAAPSKTILSPEIKTRPELPPDALAFFIDAKMLEMKGRRGEAISALNSAIRIDSTSATLYGSLARNLAALHRYQNAVAPARKAVRLSPSDASHRWLLYKTLMEGTRDTASAVEQLEAMALITPNDLRVYTPLLQTYKTQNKRQEILKVLKRISEIPGLTTRHNLFVAENYVRHRAPGRAIPIYEKILAEDPNQSQIWTRLGEVSLAAGDTVRAQKVFRTGLSQFQNRVDRNTSNLWRKLLPVYDLPGHIDALLLESPYDTSFVESLADIFILVAQGRETSNDLAQIRSQQALALLDHLLEMSPSDHVLLGKKAGLYLSLGRMDDARKTYRLAITMDPNARYWLGIARTYLRERDLTQAAKILSRLFGEAPPASQLFPQIVTDLGWAYTANRQFSEAREVYRQASEARPEHLHYLLLMGRTYALEKTWTEAIPVFEDLIQGVEENSNLLKDTLYELGHSYERAGQFEESVEVFLRLLAMDPENHQALNYLGYMLAEKGIRLNEAQDYVERALKAEPQNGAYLDSMGWVHYQRGRYRESMNYLVRALELEEARMSQVGTAGSTNFMHKNLAIIHDHAGDAAHAVGNEAKARLHWQRAAEFDPENDSIRNKLQSLNSSQPPGGQ
jgi:tetratricopeptide (TPR) repeat protein